MFYKEGIDFTNDKQMFNFLKNHFEYYTMNSWNRSQSIANNVKLYRLDLSGDWCVAWDLLNAGRYDTIKDIIRFWEEEHPGYKVVSNGRSDGYLVLTEDTASRPILPDAIAEAVDFDEYERFCEEFYGSVEENRGELVFYTELVQDFDKLCDELRDYCDALSTSKFEVIEMDKAVDRFNQEYADDLEYLGFSELSCDDAGRVDLSEITNLHCLCEAFTRIADRPGSSYELFVNEDSICYFKKL